MSSVEAIDRSVSVTRVALDEYDVRGALVVGDRSAVVWDTLSRPADMRPFLPLIGDRELVIVYSHADWDHIWGTAGLPYKRARIIAHALTQERFGTDVPDVLARRQTAEPHAWNDVVLVPPAECFDRGYSLDLGGLTLELHHLPGHTPDCIVGLIPERGVLLAGDTVETPCPVVPANSPLAQWIAALSVLADDARVRTVVPAHGPIGGREILRQNITYLEGILTGHPIDPPGVLTEFYRETHLKNMKWGVDFPLFIEFAANTSIYREQDRPSRLPIIGNGPPGTFVLLPDGLRVSLPTDQIVFADDSGGRARVGFGGMSFEGAEDGRLIFLRVRELHPEDRLSPARSHKMTLEPRMVASVRVDGRPVWPPDAA